MAKQGYLTPIDQNIDGEKVRIIELIKPFDLALERNGKSNYQYTSRWHPYAVWCMGNCPSCKRDKIRQRKRKNTLKINRIKFSP